MNRKEELPKGWVCEQDLFVYEPLFSKGMVVLLPQVADSKHYADIAKKISENEFMLNKRELLLFNQYASDSNPKQPDSRGLRRVTQLKAMFNSFLFPSEMNVTNLNTIIFNKNRREEIFLPFVFSKDSQSSSDKIGRYIYPWLSSKIKISGFSGFDQFVTAGCLFGANLKGVDQNDNRLPLIKHDTPFFDGQKIVDIDYTVRELAPYEDMLLIELEQFAHIINGLASKDKKKQLIYHMPYIDYILFGVELFVHQRMTESALTSLIQCILAKKQEYSEKIKNIFSKFDIAVLIESPFDNLFSLSTNESDINVEFILNTLFPGSLNNVRNEELFLSDEQQRDIERELVTAWLQKLCDNDINMKQRDIWRDFSQCPSKEPIVTIEALFQRANMLPLALASKDNEALKTCSFLPLSEKQTQVAYSQLLRELTKINPSYSDMVNLTVMDFVVACTLAAKGYLFYMQKCPRTISRLIREKNLLTIASRNIAFFSSDPSGGSSLSTVSAQQPMKLTDALSGGVGF